MNNWKIVKDSAEKFFIVNAIWLSFIERKRYSISEVNEKRIKINRLSGGNSVSLTKRNVIDSIDKLKKCKRIKKGKLLSAVARETALVTFHPFVNGIQKLRKFIGKIKMKKIMKITSPYLKTLLKRRRMMK